VTDCNFYVEYSADDEVNAHAEGTNKVVVNHGLLQYLETENEVAAVLGHEFGHHIAKHIEERRTNAAIGAVIGAVIAGGAILATGAQNTPSQPNAVGDTVNSSAKLGAQVGALSYSKEEEREADLLSAFLLARADYDLEKAGRVWRVLATLDGDTKSSIFSSHPSGPERMAAWEKTIVLVDNNPDQLPDWKP
jgi:predicted Zn-dependent protease